MQCANIVLISFEVKDQNLELIDNVAALEKRYGAKVNNDGEAVNVVSVHVGPGEEDSVLDLFRLSADDKLPVLSNAGADNGLYLIMHAGPTESRPDPGVLAEQTARLIVEAGVRFRKINLAGCFTGGNKLGNVSTSVLAQYTQHLAAAFNDRRAELGTPWVCAYLTEVTTFDAESGYFKQLLKERGAVADDPLEGMVGVHNLVKKGKALMPTHRPAQAAHAEALEQAVNAVLAEVLKGPAAKKFLRGRDPNQLSEPDRQALDEIVRQQWGGVRKKQKAQDQVMNGLDGVISDCERYMREKVVVRYDAVTGTFRPASLAQYTDNQTARTLLSQVPQIRGAEKFVFHL